MAEKNITRKQALQFAMKLIEDTSDAPEFVAAHEVLGKMLEQISKPRKAVISKARKINENLASEVANLSGDEVTTKDVVAFGIPEITTTQKAAAVLRVATEMGLFEKATEGKKVTYKKVITE